MDLQELKEKIQNRLRHYYVLSLQSSRILQYYLLSDCKQVDGKPIRNQPVLLKGAGKIIFSGKVNLGCYPSPFFFNGHIYIEARRPSARIEINDGSWLNNNCVLISEYCGISIGCRSLLGTGVQVIDSDFHGLQPDARRQSTQNNSSPVIIGDDSFIGSNARILKGVSIGKNSVIANSAVVVSNIPANVIAGGNPCRVIRNL